MRNKVRCCVIGVALMVAGAAQAEKGAYLGASLGQSKYSGSFSKGWSVVNANDKPTGGLFFGGYQFDSKFAIESGFGVMGAYTGTAAYQLDRSNFRYHFYENAVVVYAAAKGTIDLGSNFSLYGKAGMSGNNSIYKESGRAKSDNDKIKYNAMGAIGVQYQIAPHFIVGLEYANFGKIIKGAEMSVSHLGVNGRYQF